MVVKYCAAVVQYGTPAPEDESIYRSTYNKIKHILSSMVQVMYWGFCPRRDITCSFDTIAKEMVIADGVRLSGRNVCFYCPLVCSLTT